MKIRIDRKELEESRKDNSNGYYLAWWPALFIKNGPVDRDKLGTYLIGDELTNRGYGSISYVP